MLAGIQASLGGDPSLEVIGRTLLTSEQELYDLRPDVVIFDIASVQPELRYVLAQDLPGLLLVGVDPDRNRAALWAGQQLCELSTSDLVELIRRQSQKERDADRESERR